MLDGNGIAGPGAECPERAPECRQDWQNSVPPVPGSKLVMNLATGREVWQVPPHRREVIALRDHVPNLLAFATNDGAVKFEYLSNAAIDSAEAVDLQCRAGWQDGGYGFYGFSSEPQGDGTFKATWYCGGSRE